MDFFHKCQDVQEIWNTTSPSFSVCFQQTALVWTPCLVPWLFLPFEIYTLKKSRACNIPWSFLSITKLVFSSILTLLAISNLTAVCYSSAQGDAIAFYQFVSPAVLVATFLLTIAIIFFERKYGIRSSGLLFFFWIFLFLCDTITFRSIVWDVRNGKVRSDELVKVTLFFAHYPLVIGQFLLSLFNDKRPTYHRVGDTSDNPCPFIDSTFVSKLTFSWLNGVIWKGYRTNLKPDDVPDALDEVRSSECVPPLTKSWTRQLKSRGKATFQRAIIGIYWKTIIKVWTIKLFGELMGYVYPVTLGWYLQFISSDKLTWHGYVFVLCMFLVALTESLAVWHATFFSTFVSFGTRVSCISMVFRKCLTLSNSARQEQVVGKIVNHVAVDVNNLFTLMMEISYTTPMLISMSFGVYLIYCQLGVAAFFGLVTVAVLFVTNVFVGNYLKTLEGRILTLKDQRIKLINEAVVGIKVLKMFAWEPPFMENISRVRREELAVVRLRLFLENLTVMLWTVAPLLVTVSCLTAYVLLSPDNILDPPKIFVTISIISIIKGPMLHLSTLVMRFVQAYVSVKRLNMFMDSEDLNKDNVQHNVAVKPAVLIDNCTLAWSASDEPVLRGINFQLDVGKLIAVVGPVGCGKSSLVAAILGEMRKLEGGVNTKGSIGYVSQHAWIQNATLMSNVLFGRVSRPEAYRRVLEACSLTHDLTVLPAGDQTEIGEKGVNLSGGQKQRVSLARAVYQDCDVYLLDDPLSAVDAHVGNHIFENVIGPNGLLRNKSRILVTHSVTHLRSMDQIVFMDSGRIVEVGTYDQLMERRGSSATFLETYGHSSRKVSSQRNEGSVNNDLLSESDEIESSSAELLRVTQLDGALITEEQMEEGQVKKSVYLTYIRYLSYSACFGFAALQALGFACFGGSQVWLSLWSVDTEAQARDPQHRNMRLYVYMGLSAGFATLVFGSLLALMAGSLRASATFHTKMLSSVLRSPASFFDTTPSGRIVNRFSKDVEVIDADLVISAQDGYIAAMDVVTALVIICVFLPVFLSVVAVISVFYAIMQKIFVTTTDQLRRLESVTRSPVISLLTEMITGASVVRSFNRQADFISKFEDTLDRNIKNSFYNRMIFRSMGLRLDLLGNVMICVAAVIGIWKRDEMSSGVIALVVTYASVINFYLAWLVYCIGLVESNIVSVERLHEYINLSPEASWESEESKRPDPSWPQHGCIELRDYSTRYREELPPVLSGISLDIGDREKVGIVGRTGAGKTSVTLALLRIIEATEGSIVIDGVDIATIGLHDLRSRLTIIPQDPVLFTGSLRMNLDPFDRHSDDELWQVLDHAHLKGFVSSLSQGLLHEVAEGGENLSVGQRQLLCLARALLRKSRILILDEATAAVDLETDDIIQATIRREFQDCTVVTIAHRLNTVMDNNRLVVMEAGKVKECGNPALLLDDKDSTFFSMARHSGLNRRRLK